MNIKKHIQQNSDTLVAIASTTAVLAVTTTTIILMAQKRELERTLGAASFVIQDLGGNAVDLISEKLIEYNGK